MQHEQILQVTRVRKPFLKNVLILQRPNHVETTSSRLITEVKQR